jgi:hypothetical protein
MYDNTMYTFHGQCDLVMVSSASFDNGRGLDLHARTVLTDRSWSFISNVALRIGEDILEIGDKNSHYFNGMKDVKFPIMMADKYQVSRTIVDIKTTNDDNREEVTEQKLTYTVDLINQQSIVLQTFRNMISINVGTHLPDPQGMLGYHNRKGMIGRDGDTVLTDANEMGYQWQVQDYEPKIFHEVKRQPYPESCRIPSSVSDQRRRLGQTKTMSV